MDDTRANGAGTQKGKRAYAPPSVTKVPLRPEEAVLGFCKNNVTAGPRGGNCKALGVCSTAGS